MRPPWTLSLTANHCGLTPASSSKQTFSMSKKVDRHAKEARDDGFNANRRAKELAMTDSMQIAAQKSS